MGFVQLRMTKNFSTICWHSGSTFGKRPGRLPGLAGKKKVTYSQKGVKETSDANSCKPWRTKNNNRGNFNVMKKTTNPTDVRDYIPCLYCNGFFKQRLWSKHAQKCPGLAAKKKVPFSQKQHNMKSRKRFQAKVAHEPAENYDPEQEEVPEPEVEEPEQSQAKEYQYQCNLCYNMCKRSIFRLRRPIQFPRS